MTVTRMTVLAIDTCFAACSVAVRTGNGQPIAEQFEGMDKGHSERVVPMIGEVLARASFSVSDVTEWCVTIGPGSFTGVRTGLAVARGLALATGCPIRGTTSLHVMAAQLQHDGETRPIAIAVATRDGLVYFQAFAALTLATTVEPRLATPADAASVIANETHLIAGSGAALVVAAAAAEHPRHRLHEAAIDIHAADLARMADRLPMLSPPKPLYLREADAKPQSGTPLTFARTRT